MEDNIKRKTISIEGQHNRYLVKRVNKDKPPEVKKMNISTNLEKELNIHKEKIVDHAFQQHITRVNYLNDTSNIEYKPILQHFQKLVQTKMNSYLKQDEQKNRIDEEKPLLLNDIYELLIESHMKCYYCKHEVYIYYEKYRDKSQWTLERINNDLGHFKSNCVISCLECNLQRRNHNMSKFKFTKNLVIVKDNGTD